MKPLISTSLICALFVVFTIIAGCGISLVKDSIEPSNAEHSGSSSPPSRVDMSANDHGIHIKLTTGIPGLVIFIFGVAGLLILLIRIPVKQIKGIKDSHEDNSKGGMGFGLQFMRGPELILNEKVERIPLLVWWIIQRRNIAVRMDPPHA